MPPGEKRGACLRDPGWADPSSMDRMTHAWKIVPSHNFGQSVKYLMHASNLWIQVGQNPGGNLQETDVQTE